MFIKWTFLVFYFFKSCRKITTNVGRSHKKRLYTYFFSVKPIIICYYNLRTILYIIYYTYSIKRSCFRRRTPNLVARQKCRNSKIWYSAAALRYLYILYDSRISFRFVWFFWGKNNSTYRALYIIRI